MAKAISLEELPILSKTNLPTLTRDYSSGAAFLIDKPISFTSFDVVKILRRLINVKKVGHAGTLDPLADGLLILCVGRATKSISQIQELDKTYQVEVTLGSTTPSLDRATEVESRAEYSHIEKDNVEEVLNNQFTGEIYQVPPMYSAVKVAGQRLYKKARKGETVERQARPVHIKDIKLLNFDLPGLDLEVRCSKGTYIRTLAYDIGKALGSLGYVTQLRRTAIGPYSAEEAMKPEELKSIFESDG